MSPLHKNKYRFRRFSGSINLGTKGYLRTQAIRAIIRFTEEGKGIGKKITFEQRKITDEHKQLLMDIAEQWRKLDLFEAEVKNRKS